MNTLAIFVVTGALSSVLAYILGYAHGWKDRSRK